MCRLVFNCDEAVACIAILTAENDCVRNVSVDQHAKTYDRFVTTVPGLQCSRLKGDLACYPAMCIMGNQAALRHESIYE